MIVVIFQRTEDKTAWKFQTEAVVIAIFFQQFEQAA